MNNKGSNVRKTRWGILLYLGVLLGSFWVFRNFTANEIYPIVLEGNTPIFLGISIVEQDYSTILKDLDDDQEGKLGNWLTSFLLQSPQPAALLYLDYISIPQDPNIPTDICFKTITVSKSENIPGQITTDINLSGLQNLPDKYIYTFPTDRCMTQGQKYIMPHVLLGVLPVNSSANFLFQNIQGFRAADYFPFDKREIVLNITVESDQVIFPPSFETVVAQEGWDGNYIFNSEEKPVLQLTRFSFYKWVLAIFFIIMAVIIPLLNNVVEETGGFFEVSFGLLLGLWGMHEILTPTYIKTSIPIDIAIYTLYILVIAEILIILLPEYTRKSLRIWIEDRNKDHERAIIENPSFIPIDLTSYILTNKLHKRFPFPPTRLRGRFFFRTHKIIIWTKSSASADQNKNRYEIHHYWNEDKPVWTDDQDTIFLKAPDGKTIISSTY